MCVTDDKRTLACNGARKHCYDFSSRGYVNLAGSRGTTGDSKQAVRSRTDFLNKGYYAPIADRLVELIKKYKSEGFVVDAGCGEGYYTERVASCGYRVMGIDLSKFAVDTLASRLRCKTNKDAFAVVSSIFEMPLTDGCADAVLSIFAPCAEAEIYRVLSNDGIFIVVSAGKEHLMGLKRAIYSNAYENEERADMPRGLRFLEKSSLSYEISIGTNKEILDLFSMTPYYWRTSQNDFEKLKELSELTTKIDIDFSVYTKDTTIEDN